MQNNEVTNVHEALSRAVESEKNRVALINANFKINPIKKEIADGICETNGTTLSAFLRECVEGLIKDFVGPKAYAKIPEGTVETA